MLKLKVNPILEDDENYIINLVNQGHVEKVNGEYYWTEDTRKFIEAIIRLNRYMQSPYWEAYYKISDFSKRKISTLISDIHFAWKGITNN